MPSQKRSSNLQQNDEQESPQHQQRRKQSRRGGDKVDQQQQPTTSSSLAIPQSPHEQPQQQPQEQEQEQEQEQHSNEQHGEEDQTGSFDQDPVEKSPEDDSDGSGTDPEDFDEIITVLRSDLRNNVQCPICLGIIKKTRTVMGCLHRFCRECIDKSMRLGNNECPACRIHCASRRSLRDDQLYDSLIDAIYPDADKYEEEELLFCEEEKTRNEQIQASIAQIYRRQSEALNKRRKLGKEMDDYSPLQSSRSCRKLYSRRRNNQKIEVEGCVDIEKDNANGNDKPASSEKHGTEIKRGRRNRRTGLSTTSPTANIGDGSSEKPVLQNSQERSAIEGLRNPRNLTWGGGGVRSSTRYGSGGSSRVAGGVSKLIGHLEDIMIAETESDVHSMPTSSENGRNPSSERPSLNSHSGLSADQVVEPEPASHEKKLDTEGVEMPSIKSTSTSSDIAVNSEASLDVPNSASPQVTWPDTGPQILDGKENLAGISCASHNDHLVANIHA